MYRTRFMLLLLSLVVPKSHAEPSMYYLSQRTLYLETLTSLGAWWANPALLADIQAPVAMSTNVTPLGGEYIVATARFCLPVAEQFGIGIGFLGSGPYIAGSSSNQARQNGFTARGEFIFSRPSVEVAAGGQVGPAGRFGLLGYWGSEGVPDFQGETRRFPLVGLGGGWISPAIYRMFYPSVFLVGTGYLDNEPYWEYTGRAGIMFASPEGLVRAAVESSLSWHKGIGFWYTGEHGPYEVIKAHGSVKIFEPVALLVGLSSDRSSWRESSSALDNGINLHVGTELRPSHLYPFHGGYEIGVDVQSIARAIHRFWFGYSFGLHKG